MIFAPPAGGRPIRRYEANLGALGKLGPRPARMSAMLRRDSAHRSLREAEERPAARIKLGQIWICFVATRAKQARRRQERSRHDRRKSSASLRASSRAVPRRARREAVDKDRLAVPMPSQGARCRARSETAKTMRDGVRVARRAGRTGAEGRVLDRGGGQVSPAPLWWETWG